MITPMRQRTCPSGQISQAFAVPFHVLDWIVVRQLLLSEFYHLLVFNHPTKCLRE